ncbi:MAG: hypothetical protein IT260_19125 [Saprospiraceae bacterium]|nr:hypothetical protein [Saprospiraceae bacterium]
MKHLLYLLAWLLPNLPAAQAQCGFSISFDSQAEIDAFPSMYPDCIHLDVWLDIHNAPDVTNLDSLQQIVSSSSRFWIENCPKLTDISGLRNIKTFKDLRIANCDALSSLHGLEQAKYIEGLNIGGNAALTDLISFDSLERVGGIALSDNPALVSLGRFPRLKTVDSHISITQLAALASFAGAFPVLEHVPQLTVDSCANFTSFSGFDRLRSLNTLQVWRNHQLQNFNGLDSLRQIGALLVAQDLSQLRSLEGMPNLESIRDLNIRRNARLEALPGLPKNGCLKAQLVVQDCPRLKSLTGLEGCVRSLYELRVSGCDSLQNLRGLDSLRFLVKPPPTSLGGAFLFYNNSSLENLEGLEHLDSSALGLSVRECPNFQSLKGLENLHFLQQLHINDCPRLKNLHGLEALRFLPEGFLVYENDSLETLDGLGPVIGANKGNVSVYNNPRLSNCEQAGICNMTHTQLERALSIPASLFPRFENNLPGCNHYTEVLDSCAQAFSGFSGRVFMDAECDTLPGGTLVNLPHHIIRRASDGIPLAATNNAGMYFAYAPPGEDLILKPTPVARYQTTPDSHFVAASTLPSEHLGLDFKLCPDFQFNDLRATLAPYRPPVPGFQHRYRACIENQGTKMYDGTLTLDLRSPFDNYLVLADAGGGQQILPQVVSWTITDLPQFKPRCYTVRVEVLPGAPLGEILPAKLLAETDPQEPADVNPANNLAEWPQRIVASFDPNDKTVLPEAINLETQPDSHRLQYLVRFQNTGTAPATFVEVLDTLEAGLDIRTLELLSVSHNCRMSFPADSVVKWSFDYINLPDSSSNEPASHGFIQFAVEARPGMQPTDSIRNRVGIYFDFNPVVLTNFATTRFFLPVSTSATPGAVAAFLVTPNPVLRGQPLQILLENEFVGQTKIEVLGLDGRVLRSVFREKTARRARFDLPELPAGASFFVRVSDGKTSATRLVLVL